MAAQFSQNSLLKEFSFLHCENLTPLSSSISALFVYREIYFYIYLHIYGYIFMERTQGFFFLSLILSPCFYPPISYNQSLHIFWSLFIDLYDFNIFSFDTSSSPCELSRVSCLDSKVLNRLYDLISFKSLIFLLRPKIASVLVYTWWEIEENIDFVNIMWNALSMLTISF